ncbi:MAG TPA: NUDIX domain-containing protein [Armatimonadota bacterium]|jgi:ADP-ribose pyrophosphatase YjhB (NUDIX family)
MSREYPARPIASAAGIVLQDDMVLLIRRALPPGLGIWTFPGGAVEVGETAREACARELLEETGLRVLVGPVVEAVDIMQLEGARWRYHYTVMDFLAEVAPGSGGLEAGSDACEAVWAPLGDLGRYELAPLTRQVLERARWMRTIGPGPLIEPGARTNIG